MSLFVKILPDCIEDAKKHSGLDKLYALRDQIEHEQLDDMFEKHPKPFLVRRGFLRRAGRLVGVKRFVQLGEEKHAVIVLLHLFMFDGDEYEKFYSNKRAMDTYEQKYRVMLESMDDELAAYVKERLGEIGDVRPPLSADELNFLCVPVSQGTYDESDIICESEAWIESVFMPDLQDVLPRVRDALEMIHGVGPEGDGGLRDYEVPRSGNRENSSESLYVVSYQWIGTVLYLCNVHKAGSSTSRGMIPRERLPQAKEYYFRAYPAYMLSDDKLWIRQEREHFGNFSLSKEESEILHPEGSANILFPLFVNGRAGSGKSTVLQYIYAEYFVRYQKMLEVQDSKADEEHADAYLCQDTSLPPVYFACSPALLVKAKEVVGGILRNNPDYDGLEGKWDKLVAPEGRMETSFTRSFKVFRDYLMSLIPKTGRDRFSRIASEWDGVAKDAHFIDYAKFVELWEETFSEEDRCLCGPDQSWYLIRTYIKGAKSEVLEDEEELKGFLESEKVNEDIIQSGAYRKIFRDVWIGWYKPLTVPDSGTPQMWDDQDLARYVLDKGFLNSASKFMGVFCDEAQDFTRLELKVILKTSVFSDRDIEDYQLRMLPYVFAGDKFQTLNPSGFRWDVMKTNFVEMLLEGLCPTLDNRSNKGAVKCEVNLKDLLYNYRSGVNVVGLGNRIQLCRINQFGLRALGKEDLCAQTPWRQDSSRMGKSVYWFQWDTQEASDALEEFCDRSSVDRAIIVPCLENQEVQYINSSKGPLKKFVKINDDGTTEPPVLSAASAKGLDFDFAIVYGFGESYTPDEFLKSSGTSNLVLAYFLNRLYVAVTRAKGLLLVIDSEQGWNATWSKFEDGKRSVEEFAELIWGDEWQDDWKMDRSELKETWMNNIGGHEEYDSEGERLQTVDRLFEKDGDPVECFDDSDIRRTPLDSATKYENIGLAEHNPKMMAYAAKWYLRCKGEVSCGGEVMSCTRASNRCRAFASLFDGKIKEAADIFAKSRFYDKACDCWWRIGDWRSLASVSIDAAAKYLHPFRVRVARTCIAQSKEALLEVLQIIHGQQDVDENFHSAEWKEIIRQAVFQLLDFDLETKDGELVENLVHDDVITLIPGICEKLVDRGVFGIARNLYKQAKFNMSEVDRRKRERAYFWSEPFPDLLHWEPEGEDGADEHIVAAYRVAVSENNNTKIRDLQDDERRRLLEAFGRTVGFSEVSEELQKVRDDLLLESWARRVHGKVARRALYQASAIAHYEHLDRKHALEDLCKRNDNGSNAFNGFKLIHDTGGRSFLVRLLARIALAEDGDGQIDWDELNEQLDLVLNPTDGGLHFDEECPEEEYRVAFTFFVVHNKGSAEKSRTKTILKWAQEFFRYKRNRLPPSLIEAEFDWGTLRRSVLRKDVLAVESVLGDSEIVDEPKMRRKKVDSTVGVSMPPMKGCDRPTMGSQIGIPEHVAVESVLEVPVDVPHVIPAEAPVTVVSEGPAISFGKTQGETEVLKEQDAEHAPISTIMEESRSIPSKLTIQFNDLAIIYQTKSKRVRFRLADPVEDWCIDKRGVVVDDEEKRGFLSDVALRGTPLSLTVTSENASLVVPGTGCELRLPLK